MKNAQITYARNGKAQIVTSDGNETTLYLSTGEHTYTFNNRAGGKLQPLKEYEEDEAFDFFDEFTLFSDEFGTGYFETNGKTERVLLTGDNGTVYKFKCGAVPEQAGELVKFSGDLEISYKNDGTAIYKRGGLLTKPVTLYFSTGVPVNDNGAFGHYIGALFKFNQHNGLVEVDQDEEFEDIAKFVDYFNIKMAPVERGAAIVPKDYDYTKLDSKDVILESDNGTAYQFTSRGLNPIKRGVHKQNSTDEFRTIINIEAAKKTEERLAMFNAETAYHKAVREWEKTRPKFEDFL